MVAKIEDTVYWSSFNSFSAFLSFKKNGDENWGYSLLIKTLWANKTGNSFITEMKAPTSTVDTSPWYPPLAVRVAVTSRCTQTGPVFGQQACNTSDSPVQPPKPTVSTHTQTPAANSLTLEWEANTSDRPPDLNDEWELHEALVEMVERTRKQEIQARFFFYSLYSEWDGSLFEMLNKMRTN